MIDVSLDLTTLANGYDGGALSVTTVMETVLARIEDAGDDHVWIYRCSTAEVMGRAALLDALTREQAAALPLFGIPFAVKDNIDVAGMPTTAGCPDFAYMPERTSPVVQSLLDAGAILIGKTNLDQFATGLVGVRSPYGVPAQSVRRALCPRRIKLRFGGRGVLRAGQLRARHRYGGIRARPGRLQQHRGPEADQGRPEHDRRRSGLPLARLRLDLRAHQRRCRRRLRRGERLRSSGPLRAPGSGQAAPGHVPLRRAAGGRPPFLRR